MDGNIDVAISMEGRLTMDGIPEHWETIQYAGDAVMRLL